MVRMNFSAQEDSHALTFSCETDIQVCTTSQELDDVVEQYTAVWMHLHLVCDGNLFRAGTAGTSLLRMHQEISAARFWLLLRS